MVSGVVVEDRKKAMSDRRYEDDPPMTGELRRELIQVAAVAVAILEDLTFGEAKLRPESDEIWLEIVYERVKQDGKWGPQHHDPFTWLMILMEEVGEVAEEIDPSPRRAHLHEGVIRMGRKARRWLEEHFAPTPEPAYTGDPA